MALVQFSGGVNSVIGKIGGSVFQRYGSLSILKNNRNWNKKESSHWQQEKQRIAVISAGWRELSAANRTAWEAMTSSYPTKDPFGNTRIPSGYELYMRLNTPLFYAGQSVLVTPIAPEAFTAIGAVSVGAGGAAFIVAAWTTSVSNREFVQVYATRALSAGKALPTGGFCFMGQQEGDTTQSLEITTAWESRYGAQRSGMKIWVKFQVLNIYTGEKGVESFASFTFA